MSEAKYPFMHHIPHHLNSEIPLCNHSMEGRKFGADNMNMNTPKSWIYFRAYT